MEHIISRRTDVDDIPNGLYERPLDRDEWDHAGTAGYQWTELSAFNVAWVPSQATSKTSYALLRL